MELYHIKDDAGKI